MKHRVAVAVVAFSLAICGPHVSAQSSDGQSGQQPATPPRMATPPLQILVTGCLKRSSDGSYYLTDSNGTTWQLSSSSVNLGEHIMHVVSVGGKPASFDKVQQAGQPSDKTKPADNPAHSLRVVTLKMVSNSCTR